MRTFDVTKLGIDRNFLRRCEEKYNLISPIREEGEFIIHKKYKPRNYSQEEIEIVWNAYLYRKLGLSIIQIKKLINGEKVEIRKSLNEIIKSYEKQIEELKLLVKFTKYVKGIGFIPNPPKETMNSANFREYLVDFIEYLDSKESVEETLKIVEIMSKVDDGEKLNEEDVCEIENIGGSIIHNMGEDIAEGYSNAFFELKNKLNLSPTHKLVQENIYKIFEYQKKIAKNEALTLYDFASTFLKAFSIDSDISVTFVNLLGEEVIDFFIKALEVIIQNYKRERKEDLI